MRVLLVALLAMGLASCASTETAAPAKAAKVTTGFAGWNTVGENIWLSTRDGRVVSKAKAGKSYLVSPAAYKNFVLEVEFKPSSAVNSGVFINCADSTKIGSKNCYEANISDNHSKPEFRTGSIVRHAPPVKKMKTINKWNKLVFTSNNGTITADINGVKNTIKSDKHPSGHIGLQRFKDGIIQFRNIKITEL